MAANGRICKFVVGCIVREINLKAKRLFSHGTRIVYGLVNALNLLVTWKVINWKEINFPMLLLACIVSAEPTLFILFELMVINFTCNFGQLKLLLTVY